MKMIFLELVKLWINDAVKCFYRLLKDDLNKLLENYFMFLLEISKKFIIVLGYLPIDKIPAN
jgi:hypothetical protein